MLCRRYTPAGSVLWARSLAKRRPRPPHRGTAIIPAVRTRWGWLLWRPDFAPARPIRLVIWSAPRVRHRLPRREAVATSRNDHPAAEQTDGAAVRDVFRAASFSESPPPQAALTRIASACCARPFLSLRLRCPVPPAVPSGSGGSRQRVLAGVLRHPCSRAGRRASPGGDTSIARSC